MTAFLYLLFAFLISAFATLLIYLGNDTKAVSSALGHSQTQITNDTYIHIFEEHNARISDSLCNDLLNTATK